MSWLFVALGGCFGAICRYACYKILGGYSQYLGTFFVNFTGSFLIGFLAYFLSKYVDESLKVFIIIGFLGAFTTFSSFSLEAFGMIEKGEYFKMITYVLSMNIGAILLAYLGVIVAKMVSKAFM